MMSREVLGNCNILRDPLWAQFEFVGEQFTVTLVRLEDDDCMVIVEDKDEPRVERDLTPYRLEDRKKKAEDERETS